jgi:hypothetical protein
MLVAALGDRAGSRPGRAEQATAPTLVQERALVAQ